SSRWPGGGRQGQRPGRAPSCYVPQAPARAEPARSAAAATAGSCPMCRHWRVGAHRGSRPARRPHRDAAAPARGCPAAPPSTARCHQPPTGEQLAVGGKGQAEGALRMTARPEQGTTFDVPELDAAIEAPTGQPPFVRAEGERHYDVCMRLPGQVQGLAELAPQPHFPTPTSGGPVLPAPTDGDRPDGIEG